MTETIAGFSYKPQDLIDKGWQIQDVSSQLWCLPSRNIINCTAQQALDIQSQIDSGEFNI